MCSWHLSMLQRISRKGKISWELDRGCPWCLGNGKIEVDRGQKGLRPQYLSWDIFSQRCPSPHYPTIRCIFFGHTIWHHNMRWRQNTVSFCEGQRSVFRLVSGTIITILIKIPMGIMLRIIVQVAPSPSQLCRHWVSLLPHGIPPQNTWWFITISISYSVSVCLCVYAFSSLSVCMCLCSMPGLRMQSLWALSLVKQPPGQNSQRPKMQNEVKWNYFMNIHDISWYIICIYYIFT